MTTTFLPEKRCVVIDWFILHKPFQFLLSRGLIRGLRYERLLISPPRKLVLSVGLRRGFTAYRYFPLRCSSEANSYLSDTGIYPHQTRKLDAHLFQLRKQHLQQVQLILSEAIYNGCLGLLPAGTGERNSFTPLLGDVYSMFSSVAASAHRD